jgi:nifR3 family TIM-barrel protein
MKNFWKDLQKPFFVLAPMDEVTDVVFREIVAEVAPPDVFVTEFTNVDGLCSAGREKLLARLKFTDKQRPIVAQVWGLRPENYQKVAAQLVEMGFDGIDINMGCPVKDVMKIGACSALINNPGLAAEIIEATQKGAGGRIPISVKTRIGTTKINTEEWIGFLLKLGIDAIIVHGRTSKEMSKVPAHWEEIAKAVQIRDQIRSEIRIIGNGDVIDYQDGLKKTQESGVDGVMIGRGIFHNILAFDKEGSVLGTEQRIQLLLKHAKLFEKTWREEKSFLIMRKFVKIYVKDFPGASELRDQLVHTNSAAEMVEIVQSFRIPENQSTGVSGS